MGKIGQMTKSERERFKKEIAQEVATQVIRTLSALGIVPPASTSAEEETMRCGSKDPTHTEADTDAGWQAKADDVGVRFARALRKPSRQPSGPRRARSSRAG